MTDFIAVYDNAITLDLCGEILSRFNKYAEKSQPGVTGQGVNRAKKDSTDLTISGRPEWKDLHDQVMQATIAHVTRYMTEHSAMLAGAVAATMRDPANGEAYELSVENFDRLANNQIPALVTHFYRPGSIILQ